MSAMRLFGGTTHSAGFADMVSRWFPMPQTLYPRAAGIDISDASIKWIVLGDSPKERVVAWGEEPLAEGIVSGGVIQDAAALGTALAQLKKRLHGVENAHAALPEEAAYVFSMRVPEESSRQDILSAIEFGLEDRVPIAPREAVYDFDVIRRYADGSGTEIGVVVFPRQIAEDYVNAFRASGIRLLSLEVEARSIARAISSESDDESVTLLVDFGRARTGFAVLKRGIPIFTSTVAVGGVKMTHDLMEHLSLSQDDAEKFTNEKGLRFAGGEKSPEAEVILGTAGALADEVTRHFHYWDTRRNDRGERLTPVGRVYLVGGSSNLKDLPDYIAARVQAPTEYPNVWRHVCSFDEYVPSIDRWMSLQYVTAIGLALRNE